MTASLIFPASEYQNRITRLQAEMAHQNLDALLLTTPPDIFYTTGFLTRFWESPARPWFVIIPASGNPIAVIPSIGAPLMARTWISDIRTWNAPEPEDDGLSLLASTLNELPKDARIGLPMGLETHLRAPLATYETLKTAIAPRCLTDGTQALHRTREIKSNAEIAKIEATCTLTAHAFAAMPETLHPGMTVASAFRHFQIALLQNGADWVSYTAGGAGPDGYTDVISPATETPLVKGDILMLDTGAVKDGYFSDFDRNFAIGPASENAKRIHAALWEATQEVIETLHSGMRASDVHRLLWTGLERRGANPGPGRLGHGLGTALTEWPSFTPVDHTVLRAGMVLTIEPSAFTTGNRFLTHEENIVLTENGARLLSPRAPETLPEIT